MGFRNIAMPPASGIKFQSGAPYDVMRNLACEDALRGGFQWIFFLDDDVITPPDVVARLMSHGADVISGLYYRRQEPICPVAMTMVNGKATWVTTWDPPNSVVEVDLVGAGCLLIHRRVLQAIGTHWFEWEIGKRQEDRPKDRQAMSEDFAFCIKAKQAGFKVYLDTSIACDHVGLGQSSGGNFRPSAPL